MRGIKYFQPGHPPYGPCLTNSGKKRCCRGHEFKHVYVDVSGQRHRWCLECTYINRRQRKAEQDKPREPSRIVREYIL